MSDNAENPKKRRVLEKLPRTMCVNEYNGHYSVGRSLFGDTELPISVVRERYPIRLSGGKSTVSARIAIINAHWAALPKAEVDRWNDLAEPGYTARKEAARAERDAELAAERVERRKPYSIARKMYPRLYRAEIVFGAVGMVPSFKVSSKEDMLAKVSAIWDEIEAELIQE